MSFGQNFAYSKTKEVDVAFDDSSQCTLSYHLSLFRRTLEHKIVLTLWLHISTSATMKEFTLSTLERHGKKLMLAARVIAAIPNPRDILVSTLNT